MPISHVTPTPSSLPFHASGFGWDAFERFCGAWLVSGATLPNLNLASNPEGPSRLRIVDAQRFGGPGENQLGIDLLARMETGACWVIQCKRVEEFDKSDFVRAVAKAEQGFSSHKPDHYLLWVTGDVKAGATLLADEQANWTLWSAERMTNEFIQHAPSPQRFTIIQQCFNHAWAKAFFPIPDDLLIQGKDFFARWDGPDRSFHHHAELVGRDKILSDLLDFTRGSEGAKALILTARGGVGKSRLLKGLAEQIETNRSGRSILFVNPYAASDADMPRSEDLGKLTIVHDDAHRNDVPNRLLAQMAGAGVEGSRLLLSTRPGAENSLRERLMAAGYQAKNIAAMSLKNLSKEAMRKLAASLMGKVGNDTAKMLADLSGGCALITVVGAELIRKGELSSQGLQMSEEFAREVFTRFEGEELYRVSASLDRGVLEKLLRTVALLSPWSKEESEEMAAFLGISRGVLESACDSLLNCGLMLTTRDGLRVTPDLFSDHLAYTSCFDANGTPTDFIERFLLHFGTKNTVRILQNLSQAQWRVVETHGATAENVIAPLWRQILKEFEWMSFWDRSLLLETWGKFAIYLPNESLELAEWTMELKSSPQKVGYDSINTQDQALNKLPSVLKPIAIWNEKLRHRALDLLWRLETEFPERTRKGLSKFETFAEVASFRSNFPLASSGLLDWLEMKVQGRDGATIADSPCALLNISLRPYFERIMEVDDWLDHQTCVSQRRPVDFSATKSFRHRALKFITEKIVPRGTVAAVNVIPILGYAMRSTSIGYDSLAPSAARRWNPERKLALQAMESAMNLHRNHWVHFVIRRKVRWHIIYGDDAPWRNHCLRLVSGLLDNLEMRLARLTLSSSYDDSLDLQMDQRDVGWYKQQKIVWAELLRSVTNDFLIKYDAPHQSKHFLEKWVSDAENHGYDVRLGEFLSEIARQNQSHALAVLDAIMDDEKSLLFGSAANLLHYEGSLNQDALESRVQRALNSKNDILIRSFLNVLQYAGLLQSGPNISCMMELAKRAKGTVLSFMIKMVDFPNEPSWAAELTELLAERDLAPHETRTLAGVIAKQERFGGPVSAKTIGGLMRQLEQLPSLNGQTEDANYLHWLADQHPAKLYQLFLYRIQFAENSTATPLADFEPIPSHPEVSLRRLSNDPDFENLAKHLLETIFNHSHGSRSQWIKLFIAAVSRTSPLLGPLLTERLRGLETKDDLRDFVSLMRYDRSVAVYRYPDLVSAILSKAKSYGPTGFDEILSALIHAGLPQYRSHVNGVLNEEFHYARIEAEKAYSKHREHPILGTFYLKIVEIETADAEWQKRRIEATFESDW